MPSIGIIDLALGCRAHSASLLLPPTYLHKNHVEITVPILYSLDISIWDVQEFNITFALQHAPDKVYQLSENAISIDSLLQKVHQHIEQVKRDKLKSHTPWYIYAVIVSAVILVIGFILFITYKFGWLAVVSQSLRRQPCGQEQTNNPSAPREPLETKTLPKLYPTLETSSPSSASVPGQTLSSSITTRPELVPLRSMDN